MTAALETHGLNKSFGALQVAHDINFRLAVMAGLA
jgi:ABC-type branched-subunit amino acid transport system ATPase component